MLSAMGFLAVFLCGFVVGAAAMVFWVSWHSVGPLQHEPTLEEVEQMHAALEKAVQLAQQVESISREFKGVGTTEEAGNFRAHPPGHTPSVGAGDSGSASAMLASATSI
jgi:TRAP-type C4-dicarboxylate transport system permease large subunit